MRIDHMTPEPAPERVAIPERPLGRPVKGTLLRTRWVRTVGGRGIGIEVRNGVHTTIYELTTLEREAAMDPGGYADKVLRSVEGSSL